MERIGDEIERTLSRGGSREAIPLARLTSLWPTAVGDAIARNAWPLRIAGDGTLHVATASATWANELALLSDEILGRLREQLADDTPTRLRCAVGPIPEAATPEPSDLARQRPEITPEAREAAASVASAIEDPELRELVSRAARASLSKGPSDRHF